MRRTLVFGLAPVLLGGGGVLGLVACGSRGPLDIEIVEDIAGEAGTVTDAAPDVDAAPVDATPDAGPDAEPQEASIIDCPVCLANSCGKPIVDCLLDPACRTAFQCATQTCFLGGNTSPSCLLQCASNPKATVGVLAIVSCVTGKCGTDCASVLGSFGN